MSCHLQNGTESKIAFVFSCPGKNEMDAGFPAAKATGTNLNTLLQKLSVAFDINNLIREKVTISNAWDKVEYETGEGNTGRSEATDSEILCPINIQRLNNEIGIISKLILCCGDKAILAVEQCALKEGVKVVSIVHLGNKGLNSIKVDVNNQEIHSAKKTRENGDLRSLKVIGKNNTSKRIDVICTHIVEQI